MTETKFQEFKKIPRLSREIVISEKIDGTNGIIYIGADGEFLVGSKSRWLDDHNDNHGFWHWAMENKEDLLKLGVGYHYGEWWGSGINSGYGLPKGQKRFSLFNAARWVKQNPPDNIPPLGEKQEYCPDCCEVVPVLWRGMFDTVIADAVLQELKVMGSRAVKGFLNPEGIVVYHKAGNVLFKKTIEDDDSPKSIAKEK